MDDDELAIARTVIYASLFEYPLTLEQLHQTLISSDLSPSEILVTYRAGDMLQRIVEYGGGFFFPRGRRDLIAERQRREARSRVFLDRHRFLLRLLCAVPFTRMVALSGSMAHLNLEPDGDLDLFIVTRGRRVWMVTLAVLVLTKLIRRRRFVCANFVIADSHLALEQQDLFTANQAIHLKPLIGEDVFDAFLAANPFIARYYPNGMNRGRTSTIDARPSVSHRDARCHVKPALELLLDLPSPLIELVCRALYRWHLRRRARSWRSPEQVRLEADYLKLHTQSHRGGTLERFDLAVRRALERAERSPDPTVVAGAGPRAARAC